MLKVWPATVPAVGAPFRFTVPGQYTWRLITVYATLSRVAGGTNTRAPVLTLTDGTTTFLGSQFLDTAPDPGTITITWADIGNVQAATYATGFASVPLPTLDLPAGYVITGTIANPVAGDAWLSAVAFVDQAGP